jgi:hypothetical protein
MSTLDIVAISDATLQGSLRISTTTVRLARAFYLILLIS